MAADKGNKLTITGYEKPGQDGLGEGKKGDHIVMINPATINVGKRIIRNSGEKPHGKQEFSSLAAAAADTLSFELLIDGTGVVDEAKDVHEEVAKLEDLLYSFQSESHQSNFLEIKWGQLLFRGYLTSFQINYTLFDKNGNALRAKLSLSVEGYIPPAKFERDGNFSSPDMTHVKFVKQGDTLAKFCKDIYGDVKYMIQVAQFNQLVNFRKLESGTRLEFPPLRNL